MEYLTKKEKEREAKFLDIQDDFYKAINKAGSKLFDLDEDYQNPMAVYSFLFLLLWTSVEHEAEHEFHDKKIGKAFLKDMKTHIKNILKGDRPKAHARPISATVLH
jgi:hypothetical protein